MEKMTKNFYLKRIEYLEKELKEKEEKLKLYNNYIIHLEDKYNDIVKLIDDDIGDEFYVNLEFDGRLLYRIRDILKGSDSNE